MKDIIKKTLIEILTKDFGHVDNIDELIVVRENKDLSKGDYSVSLHAFANAINKA